MKAHEFAAFDEQYLLANIHERKAMAEMLIRQGMLAAADMCNAEAESPELNYEEASQLRCMAIEIRMKAGED